MVVDVQRATTEAHRVLGVDLVAEGIIGVGDRFARRTQAVVVSRETWIKQRLRQVARIRVVNRLRHVAFKRNSQRLAGSDRRTEIVSVLLSGKRAGQLVSLVLGSRLECSAAGA